MNVRERLSLCYYCGANYDAVKGAVFVNSGIEFSKKKQTIDEILTQLGNIKKGDITDAELSDAKLRIIDAFFEYEISNKDFCAVFCWNGGFTIMTYVKREIERGFAYQTLKNACISINNELNLQ